jgi:uncharacterized NAD-dependent epimerase/dehydratase family protein
MVEHTTKIRSEFQSITGTAVILTNGKLAENWAKTAHGLIRGSERFEILAVIDVENAGRDAGEMLDGVHRNIPVYAHIDDFLTHSDRKPDYALVGVALIGGVIDKQMQEHLMEVLSRGISLVNGLHMALGDLPEFVEAAENYQAEIIDIRRPKPFDQLSHWSGQIFDMKVPRLAFLGTDCALGKRTTCRMIMETCRSVGINAEMIYTGQTGWFQGNRHGFILDSTLNDFVCGELEAAIVECEQESAPDLILIEGQSSMRNPVGPCGSEFIVSGNVKGIILQHAPFRKVFDSMDDYGCQIPSLESEISLIEHYGARVLAVTLNGEGGSPDQLDDYVRSINDKIKIPVLRPLEDDMTELIPAIREYMENHDWYPSTTLLKPT